MKTILLVDDNKTNLASAKMALDEFYKVIAVPMGKQALKYLESNTCDLILLDVDMPEMDGFEVISVIKERGLLEKIPVLFLTGNNDLETVTKCIKSGGMDVVTKPFVKEILLARISYILELMDYRNGK